MKKNLLQALLFSVVTGLASTISANASNDSIKTVVKQKTITTTANRFDKLYPNPVKLFAPENHIIPTLPIDPKDPILPIEPGNPDLPICPGVPVVPTPPMSTSSTYDVGSPKGTFSVNNSGAAIYSINISAPNGGSLIPSIGVSYNSQSGNGLAGFGFNITGLSSITRGCKDLYHDKQITGTSYDIGDALFLNGQRLILKTGAYGYNGSTYTPEGDPYTIVTLHDNINTNACWFSVVCTDGKTYQLGNTSESRLSFVNRKNVTCIAAWYINQTTDIHCNLVKYHYTTTNYNRSVIEGAFQGFWTVLKYETGGWKQWVRLGNSYSKSGDFQTKPLRWGASPYYTKKIGNPTLRNINQNLRNTKFPYDNWRTADPGHIHYKWRLNDEDSWHWFR